MEIKMFKREEILLQILLIWQKYNPTGSQAIKSNFSLDKQFGKTIYLQLGLQSKSLQCLEHVA